MKRIGLVSGVVFLAAFSGDEPFKDGKYNGLSRAIYTYEPYYGHTQIIIENGKIIEVDFFIRDSLKQEPFDDKYEKYFAGNDVYIQQCRNDWKGVQSYPDSLLKHQDIHKVDVITGATWSYNIFKASAQEALTRAVEK